MISLYLNFVNISEKSEIKVYRKIKGKMSTLPIYSIDILTVQFSTYISVGLQSDTIIHLKNNITITTPGSLE